MVPNPHEQPGSPAELPEAGHDRVDGLDASGATVGTAPFPPSRRPSRKHRWWAVPLAAIGLGLPIAALVGQGQPATGSSVSWNCETCIVASSGDLGVSIGYIRSNADPKAPPSPFFTIWRKVAGGWKYVAE